MSAAPRRRLLFHIRHFGVGGIENALIGWLRGLDRSRFEVGLSVGLPTRELAEVYRARLPADVAVFPLVTAPGLVALHQRRRDGRLGRLGRMALGVAMQTAGQRQIEAGLRRLAPSYDAVIDFDLTLRKIAAGIPAPLIGVRHFGLWGRRTAKAARVGRAYRHYDCVAVLNEAMLAQARHLFGGESRNMAVLPNAFDLDAMRRAAAAADVSTPPAPYVVCVARLDIATKGLDVLVDAWRRLLAAHPGTPATLVFVGDGPDRDRLRALVEAAGVAGRVVFAGLQTNPYPWIARARVLALASRTEGLPNVLIEALALGCMVVSSDCPVGPREILQDGQAGLLVPPDDPEALAHALWRGLHDEDARRDCLAAGAARAGYYSVEAGNERLAAIVEKVLRERQGPRA